MALYKNGGFVQDTWRFPAADEPLGEGPVAVGKDRFMAERETILARNGEVGVVIQSGESLDGLEQDLQRLRLVVLVVPRYTDGRNYSNAAMLRERHGYAGEIRVTGDVLHDQIPLMARCGVDAFDVTSEHTRRALAEGRVRGVSVHYQPMAGASGETVPAGTRPWLRVSKR
jgi:uncharacterized protein (DUF934 family)